MKIQVTLVLWDRLCKKGKKITHWDNLNDVCDYIEKIEPNLKMRVYNGELHWEEGYSELATARVSIVES